MRKEASLALDYRGGALASMIGGQQRPKKRI